MWSSDWESIFKDDIESLNTDDVLSVYLKIEMENAMKPNFHLKFYVFQTHFTCELEYWNHLFPFRRHFSYANQSQKEKQSGNNADAVLNDFTDLEKRKDLNNVWRNISLDSSDDAILILQNTKITTCDVPGCVAGANKSQTTYENIYIIQDGLIVQVYIVFCVLEYTCTFLSWKLLFE